MLNLADANQGYRPTIPIELPATMVVDPPCAIAPFPRAIYIDFSHMTEIELIAAIRERAFDPSRRTHMARLYPLPSSPATDPLPPPLDRQTILAAEDRLGFAFPPLLTRLWAEVANGGFGPGYGLFGLRGGHVDFACRSPLPDLYLDALEDPAWERFLGEPWPARLLPICDWGCCHQSAIDCSTPETEVIDLSDGFQRHPKGVSFARWMEDWVNGVNLWVAPLSIY